MADECENTDRHLWPLVSEDQFPATIHVTKDGGIGINVGGYVIVKPLEDWHALARSSEVMTLCGVLERCRTVLANMAWEREGFWNDVLGRRWPISHEPLRSDARNLLPIIDAALEGGNNAPEPMILGSCAEARSCQHVVCICEGDPTLLGTRR